MWTAENTYQMIKQILYNCEADCTVLIRKPQVISGGGGWCAPPATSPWIRPCSFRFVLPQAKWTFEHLLGRLKYFSVVQKAKPRSNHKATGKGRRQDSIFFRKIRQKRLFRDILDTKECFVDMKKVKKIEVLQRG